MKCTCSLKKMRSWQLKNWKPRLRPINRLLAFSINMIEYRWVFPSQPEFNVIREVVRQRGWTQPHPDLARALCAYDDGNHVGFIVIQLVNHIEPLFIAESYRGQGIADELADRAIAYMKENNHPFMCMADNEHVEKMCEARKLNRVESPVFRS